MDSLNAHYQTIIKKIFQDYIDFIGKEEGIEFEIIQDTERDRHLLVEVGWQNGYRIYGTFLHLDILNDKIWIQHDGTENGIAHELEAAGIPKKQIVLAFKPITNRQLTEYAVS
ncbi:MAG: XisI protein [Synechocystis sp.]